MAVERLDELGGRRARVESDPRLFLSRVPPASARGRRGGRNSATFSRPSPRRRAQALRLEKDDRFALRGTRRTPAPAAYGAMSEPRTLNAQATLCASLTAAGRRLRPGPRGSASACRPPFRRRSAPLVGTTGLAGARGRSRQITSIEIARAGDELSADLGAGRGVRFERIRRVQPRIVSDLVALLQRARAARPSGDSSATFFTARHCGVDLRRRLQRIASVDEQAPLRRRARSPGPPSRKIR